VLQHRFNPRPGAWMSIPIVYNDFDSKLHSSLLVNLPKLKKIMFVGFKILRKKTTTIKKKALSLKEYLMTSGMGRDKHNNSHTTRHSDFTTLSRY
jgi:hypothetical protein